MRNIVVKIRYEVDDGERYSSGYDLVDKPLVYDEDGDYLTYGHFWSRKIAKLVAQFLSKELR
jgi:hypothetical protein